MRCLGITKKVSRFRNDATFLYCGFHKWQPTTFVLAFLSLLGLMAGLYQDALSPLIARLNPKEREKIEISLIENDPRFHISPDFDKSSSIVSGIANEYSGFQISETNGLSSHGTSFEFMLYAQPTENLAKEPLLVEGIYLVVDHSEEDVIYNFPHGPREMTYYYEKEITLEPGKTRYEISFHQYKLQEGELDSFRIKIGSIASLRYVVHVEVTWWRPSAPSQREIFRSRQYELSFPEIRNFRDLLKKHQITAMHVSLDQLNGLMNYEKWPETAKFEVVPRILVPGFNFYFPERRGAGSRFFDALNLTNNFFDWWKNNPKAVRPSGYSLKYGEGYVGEPYFKESYIIFDDSFALLKNRGDYASVYEKGAKFQAILDHFEENWTRGQDFASRFPSAEIFVEQARTAVSNHSADFNLVYVARFFPSPYSADLLTTACAYGDAATKEIAIEALEILGLGHSRGPMIANLHKHLQQSYSGADDARLQRTIQEVFERFDLPVSKSK